MQNTRDNGQLARLVRRQMTEQNMVRDGEAVVVALSGGLDSVCLLSILLEIRKEWDLSLFAMHVHHGIRGEEADRDAEFCRELCEKKNVPFALAYIDVPTLAETEGLSVEEAARKGRYEALESYRSKVGADWIAVAHHREDNGETILWNLFRGSGLQGIGGMKPVNGHIIRPLLSVSREQIETYGREKGLTWCQDSTNEGDHYTRNRIRHHILPYVEEHINRQAVEHICHTAALAAEADGYLTREAGRWLTENGTWVDSPQGDSCRQLRLDGKQLRKEEPLLQTYVIREGWRRLDGLTDLTAAHVERVLALLTEEQGASAHRRVALPRGMEARREYEALYLEKITESHRNRPEAEDEGQMVSLLPEKIENQKIYMGEYGEKSYKIRVFPYVTSEKIPTNRYTKWLDYDRIEKPLMIRSRQTGDYIALSGGGRKSVKAYMVDEKIPAGSRDSIPVIASGSHVVWIVGYRISEQAKVTADTKRVLEITIYGGENERNDS